MFFKASLTMLSEVGYDIVSPGVHHFDPFPMATWHEELVKDRPGALRGQVPRAVHSGLAFCRQSCGTQKLAACDGWSWASKGRFKHHCWRSEVKSFQEVKHDIWHIYE